MISIKLRPVGKKKQISYRVVVLPKKSKLVGKYIDDLGWYNPHTNKFLVNAEKAKQWLANGAQPTDTVHNILVDAKIIDAKKIPLHKKSKQHKEKSEEAATIPSAQ
jgi:small subunit ribosomal protein S16